MKYFILLGTMAFNAILLFGQADTENFPKKDHYKRAMITLHDEQFFDIKNLQIVGDSVSFMHKNSKQSEKIALSNIYQLKVKKRTAVVGGAIIGTVIPFIFTLGALIDNDPNADNIGAMVAGLLIGGAAIGGAIGLAIPIWETYTFKKNNSYGINIDYKIKANSTMIGAGIVVNF